MIPSRPSRSLYKPGAAGQPVPKSEVAHHFELERNFLSQALAANSKWMAEIAEMAEMEESAPPCEAAMKILQHRDDLDTARIFLLTSGVVKKLRSAGWSMKPVWEGWLEKLKQHPDLLVEGVDLEELMNREVPPEHREEFCLSLDGRGRIRLDHATGRVVHTGPRLREVVKAILAREDDPIPLTWLHELVRQTPTHPQVDREQIYRDRIQWKSDDPDFPRDKVLWSL